jgi:aerobic-type carbon monoxide dehydrogenase small subunit (CoxS/CutS family)
VAPTRSVLAWLREDQACTGTKEGCAEGDCGACTVVLGELDAQGQLRLRPVNACIQFVPTLDGRALFTVEDIAALAAPDKLHPVQQCLVDCHGSQCGFCTPGFVMSLWAVYERHQTAATVPTPHGLVRLRANRSSNLRNFRLELTLPTQLTVNLVAIPLNNAQKMAKIAINGQVVWARGKPNPKVSEKSLFSPRFEDGYAWFELPGGQWLLEIRE